MKLRSTRLSFVAILTLVFAGHVNSTSAFGGDLLAKVQTRVDLESVIKEIKDAKVQQIVREQSDAIVAAAERKPRVDRVCSILEKARGSFVRMNDTPKQLHEALGGESSLFDGLKEINLADTGLTIKEKRMTDPFDAAFYEDVGHLHGLESLNVINTTAENAWLAPLAKLKSLKVLRITNQAKLNDAGLALLADLRQLEQFSYVGTAMTGEPFKDFKGWTNLKRTSYRGSRMSDEGLIALCAAFPNLESLVLAHGNYSDVAVAKLPTLKKLTALEIGSHKTTVNGLKHLVGMPLEYLQLGDGLDSSEGIAVISQIKTLKRLTLTNCKNTTDDDLKAVATLPKLEILELGGLELPGERPLQLKQFSYVKNLRILSRPKPYPPEVQAKIKEQLPNSEIKYD